MLEWYFCSSHIYLLNNNHRLQKEDAVWWTTQTAAYCQWSLFANWQDKSDAFTTNSLQTICWTESCFLMGFEKKKKKNPVTKSYPVCCITVVNVFQAEMHHISSRLKLVINQCNTFQLPHLAGRLATTIAPITPMLVNDMSRSRKLRKWYWEACRIQAAVWEYELWCFPLLVVKYSICEP